MTLFQANLGYTPSFLPDLEGYFCSQSAAQLATTIKEAQAQLSAILEYKKYYNKKRIPGNKIQPKDLVLLSTKNLSVIIASRKFRSCFIRPFQVVEKIGNTTSDYLFLKISAFAMSFIVPSS
ncbi:hypothetical protein DSO57_1023137 [Entomophthora muscae]|uniref:Uncharacterized protein n=1 Tax=Entomophthora muscae TaxID=34485 RepID=A0ACC2RHK2_9FUNG|nr:hypothetical protein DSO57_1023137 [Entomophthora muscae]